MYGLVSDFKFLLPCQGRKAIRFHTQARSKNFLKGGSKIKGAAENFAN